jgi:hypothetical protein
MPDTRLPLSKDDREHLRLARELEGLIVNPGWKLYTQLIEHHLKTKQMEAEAVAKNMDEALFQNAAKGAIAAFRLCLGLPEGIIRVAKDIRGKSGEDVE